MVIVTGFIRDKIFVDINELIDTISLDLNFEDNSLELAMASIAHKKLFATKWILTFLFSGAYLTMACIGVKLIFNKNQYIIYTIIFYLLIMFTSFLFYIGGMAFGDPPTGYLLARRFMGMVQSPILMMLVIPVFAFVSSKNYFE